MLEMCSLPESGLHQRTSTGDSAASTSFMAATGTFFALFASCRPIRFTISRIVELTDGKSLEANIALVKNNARVAAEVATALAALPAAGPGGARVRGFVLHPQE